MRPISLPRTNTPKNRQPGAYAITIEGYKFIVAHAWLCYLKETRANYPGKIWQYRFYDHIVRDETDFNAQTAYILNNPAVYEAKQKKMQK